MAHDVGGHVHVIIVHARDPVEAFTGLYGMVATCSHDVVGVVVETGFLERGRGAGGWFGGCRSAGG